MINKHEKTKNKQEYLSETNKEGKQNKNSQTYSSVLRCLTYMGQDRLENFDYRSS